MKESLDVLVHTLERAGSALRGRNCQGGDGSNGVGDAVVVGAEFLGSRFLEGKGGGRHTSILSVAIHLDAIATVLRMSKQACACTW